VGGYTTFSAGLSYAFTIAGNECTVRLNGDNLSNKNAWAGIGGSLLSPLTPRIFKGSLTMRF
jgi:outer membrane receptor protein involved in Fe transport